MHPFKHCFQVISTILVVTGSMSCAVDPEWQSNRLGEGRPPVPPQAVGARQSPTTGQIGRPRVPRFFIENAGQLPPEVDFYSEGRSATVAFSSSGVSIFLGPSRGQGEGSQGQHYTVQFIGGSPAATVTGDQMLDAKINYLKGSAGSWITNARAYQRVTYSQMWPGVDLVYEFENGLLKYSAIVQPGAEPDAVKFLYTGMNSLSVSTPGELLIHTSLGTLHEAAPVVYQERGGERAPVDAAYHLEVDKESGGVQVGYRLGTYNSNLPLIIDPIILLYGSYFGGVNTDTAQAIELDSAGNVYLAGYTTSTQSTFPTAFGPDLTHNGGEDAFVIKLDPTGTEVIYATYVGGSGSERLYGLAVDEAGNAYVAGETSSSDGSFPVAGSLDPTYNGGERDGFVTKIDSQGSGLVFSGFVGGSAGDALRSVVLDAARNVYVAGFTASTPPSFPVTTGPDLTHNGTGSIGWGDGFVAKINSNGTGLMYSGYVGGADDDIIMGIDVDVQGRAYLIGRTASTQTTFPVRIGPDLTFAGGGGDGFIARVAANGTTLDYAGYLGGNGLDGGGQVVVDESGSAYVSGLTASDQSTFPVFIGPDLTFNGGSDSFVARISSSGANLLYAGYIGGAEDEAWTTLALQGDGSLVVGSSTRSDQTSFPVQEGPDGTHNGLFDGYLAQVSATGDRILQAGYIGGSGDDNLFDIAFDGRENLWLVGDTNSTETTFPGGTGLGSLPGRDSVHNGGTDAFLVRVGDPFQSSGLLFLPSALRTFCAGFLNGQAESEPNNSGSAANGPLCNTLTYSGTAADQYDVFYFVAASGPMTVSLDSHTGQGVQLILYYQQPSSANEVAKDAQGPDYRVEHNGAGGRYYISVFTASGFNMTTPYRLTVTHR